MDKIKAAVLIISIIFKKTNKEEEKMVGGNISDEPFVETGK